MLLGPALGACCSGVTRASSHLASARQYRMMCFSYTAGQWSHINATFSLQVSFSPGVLPGVHARYQDQGSSQTQVPCHAVRLTQSQRFCFASAAFIVCMLLVYSCKLQHADMGAKQQCTTQMQRGGDC
jgi:hypothetical protein